MTVCPASDDELEEVSSVTSFQDSGGFLRNSVRLNVWKCSQLYTVMYDFSLDLSLYA